MWRGTILHENNLLCALSLLKCWNVKVSQHMAIFRPVTEQVVGVMFSYNNGSMIISAVKPHQTINFGERKGISLITFDDLLSGAGLLRAFTVPFRYP